MEARKWEDLGIDCLAMVFEKVGLQDLLLDVPLVCKSWHDASLLPKCWKKLDFQSVYGDYFYYDDYSDYGDYRVLPHNDTKLVQLAVARSHGTATNILLSDHWTMEGLQYIANECPLLESLTLPDIEGTEEEEEMQCVPELISKFRELVFLRICAPPVLKDVVSQIGTNCPKFVALDTSDAKDVDVEDAAAIVHFLPNMKHLTLRGSEIHREALVHILHGCRDLVLLDVRDCIGFDGDDAEILELASHVKTFMSTGSMLELALDYDYDEVLSSSDAVGWYENWD